MENLTSLLTQSEVSLRRSNITAAIVRTDTKINNNNSKEAIQYSKNHPQDSNSNRILFTDHSVNHLPSHISPGEVVAASMQLVAKEEV